MSSLRSLEEAIAWLESVGVDDRPVPVRLHDLETETQGELGAPRMTIAFIRWLTARHNDIHETTVSVDCPACSSRSVAYCLTCGGRGTYDVVRRRFRYPMWRALTALSRKPPIKPGWPSPRIIIAQLYIASWRIDRAHGIANAASPISIDDYRMIALWAINDLHSRYAIGPIPRRDEMSESQSIAEAALDTAEPAATMSSATTARTAMGHGASQPGRRPSIPSIPTPSIGGVSS